MIHDFLIELKDGFSTVVYYTREGIFFIYDFLVKYIGHTGTIILLFVVILLIIFGIISLFTKRK